jgi:phosphate butyryltransferase
MGYDEIAQRLREGGRKDLVVVAAHEGDVLQAVSKAAAENLARPVLLGDEGQISAIAEQRSIDLEGCVVEHVPEDVRAAHVAMEMVREGRVSALMKGKISTPDLMRVGLKNGLRRQGRLLTHIVGYEHARVDRMFLLSDSGVVAYPTLDQRVEIVRNAVDAMRALGVDHPRVAVLSSTEKVDPSVPCSVDASRLVEMNRGGGPLAGYGIVEGPMDLLSAMDAKTAETKGIAGEVVGRADVLHCPDVVAGNLMGKSIAYFSCDVRLGGCVVGGAVPVILLSRASPADNKYCSILLGLSC